MPEPDELGPEDHGPAQWEFLAMLPRYPDGRANLSALASAATPNNPPGLPQDGHDQDVERILQRFGLDLCAPLTTYTRTQTMHHHTSLLCTKCCNHRPKPENLHSLSEFYDAMFDEDGLPFYDAPGALPLRSPAHLTACLLLMQRLLLYSGRRCGPQSGPVRHRG